MPARALSAAEVRREARDDTVRIVEYAAFPRACSDQRRFGFTRDLSASGMCIGVDAAEPLGSLLRLTVRDAGGIPLTSAVARVVWSSIARDGRHWLGLDLVARAKVPRDLVPA